jgi:hypothetical protein
MQEWLKLQYTMTLDAIPRKLDGWATGRHACAKCLVYSVM